MPSIRQPLQLAILTAQTDAEALRSPLVAGGLEPCSGGLAMLLDDPKIAGQFTVLSVARS
jgi:hypothetical protein